MIQLRHSDLSPVQLAGVVLFLPPPQFAGLLVRKGGIRYNIWGGGEVSLPPAVTAAAYPV